MKCDVVSRLIVRLTLGVAAVLPTAEHLSAQNGYGAPAFTPAGGGFYQDPQQQAGPIPTTMIPGQGASPLAGGPAAAAGGQFIDAHGNTIVMPASYYGPAGYCPPGPADSCYGDPMAVDFGGCSEDQIGPHYFDVSFAAVFLTSDDVLDGVGPLGSITAGGPRILDPANGLDEFDPGWQIAFRYDLGPLSVFEATYMGLYDIAFNEAVRSVDVTPGQQNFQLFSVFSNFGVPTPIDGLDDASLYAVEYDSDLQSSELSYRSYWVGHSSRVSGTYLLGFRYVRMTEDFNFDIEALAGDSHLLWATANDLLGFQIGGDSWLGLRQGLRIGCEGKAGVYNNRFEFTGTGDFPTVGNAPADYSVITDGNKVAFIGEAGISIVADILPSWSVRAGYHAFYIDNLATVAANIDTANFLPAVITPENDALYHGFTAGAEYVW